MSTNELLYNRQYIYGPQPDPTTPGEPEHDEEEKEERLVSFICTVVGRDHYHVVYEAMLTCMQRGI